MPAKHKPASAYPLRVRLDVRLESKTKAQLIRELESTRRQLSLMEAPKNNYHKELPDGSAEAQLIYRLASIAASSASHDEAVRQCLELVCRHIGWPAGHLCVASSDGTGGLTPTKVWHLDDPEKFEAFRSTTEGTRLAPGVGLPGRVLSSGEPVWIPDVQKDPDFLPNQPAKDIGLRAAFGYPVRVASQTIAVLEFFTCLPVEPDEHVLGTMGLVATQVGRIIERKRVDERLQDERDTLQQRFEERTTDLVRTNERLLREVAKHERTESAVRASSRRSFDRMSEEYEKFYALVEGARDFIAMAAPDGRVLHVNPSGLRLVGLDSLEEAQSKDISEFFTAEGIKSWVEVEQPAINQYGYWEGEGTLSHFATGAEIQVEISSFLVRHPETDQPLSLATVRHDITERDQLQRQLVQADKLAAIGTLISGVAHEVNNPLAGASGRAELLLLENHDEGLKSDLKVILDEIRRASQIMRNLLSFAREHVPERTPTVINELIESVLTLLAYEFRVTNIEIQRDLDANLPVINVDPNQLRQVFLNLVVNAQHALSDSEQPRVISASTRLAGDAVIATISDNGTGIPKENLDKIFDPFFTTKPGKQGTGLGLSICFGIVQEHGGVIRAESELGKGATFTIELPVSAPG